MRLSVVMLLCALAGILGGGALIGLPALGACLIFDSLCVGVYALLREAGEQPVVAPAVHTLEQVFDRARAS